MPVLLTIAGFDPSTGAGVPADLAVFGAHGWYGTSCITSLTVQSTLGVESTHPVDPVVVRDTLDCLDADLPPEGVKIGMLGTAACVAAVAEYLERLDGVGRRPVVVLDPVLMSSSGRPLLDEQGVDLLKTRLLPLVSWVTPNLDELAVLTGILCDQRNSILDAASALSSKHDRLTVLVTGGHMEPPDDLLLLPLRTGGGHRWIAGERVTTTSTHGTGCAFSSALLCALARGEVAAEAAGSAKRYVSVALRRATKVGHGRGPMNLLWPLRVT